MSEIKHTEPAPPRDLNDSDLLELVVQLHGRAGMWGTKSLHDADGEARTELNKRLKGYADLLAKVEVLRLLLLRAEMYVLPTEQTNGLLKEIRKALES